MEIAMTRMSQNGQVVIPVGIRREAGINQSSRFIVFNQDGNILLKQIKKEALTKDMELIEKISRSEDQIKKGKYVKANSRMKNEDIDDLLMR